MTTSREPVRPRATQVLALLPITAAVAACVMLGMHPYAAVIAAMVGSICAAAAGVPALFWALEHGRTRFVELVVVGAIAGAVPVALFLGVSMSWRVLFADRAMPPVTVFRSLAGAGMLFGVPALIGALAGVIFWLTVLDRQLPRWAAWSLSIGLLWATAWSFGWGR
ncbi:MAG TPA: hypothetical protein VES67_09550 [Vicinamibacterales bacterium]|nr:hypothetical protein [Vicinamibacterales bacterium]